MAVFRDNIDYQCLLFLVVFGLSLLCAGILALFPFAMLRRHAVKRCVSQRGCESKHVRWLVWASWCPVTPFSLLDWAAMPFRVIYVDPSRFIHKAYCWVGRDLYAPMFSPLRIEWVKDEVIGELPVPDLSELPVIGSDEGKRD